MKIIHISTYDIQGGAARAAFRLHQALCARSEDSTMYVAQKNSSDTRVQTYHPEERIQKRLERMLRREWLRRDLTRYADTRPAGFEPFRDDRSEFGREVLRQMPSADVINLHWIAGFIDYQSFFNTSLSRPVLWTLHDMNPFTGGCHFDASCGRFASRCGCCPQLGSADRRDLSHRIWMRKNRAFSRTRHDQIALVAPSNWLATEARRSSMFKNFPVSVIPYGVDTDVFSPKPELNQIRHAFQIPERARVILFLAEEAENRRKGFALLNRALHEMPRRAPLFLLSLGKGFPASNSGIPHLHLGSVSNDVLLATLYGLADLFVVPSIQDNLPNTILEAMSCGTPVVGFDTGGIKELIRHRETGFLVPVENTAALAEALDEALREPDRLSRMGETCRRTIIDHFTLNLQATRYCKLYRTLLENVKAGRPHKNRGNDPVDRTASRKGEFSV